MKNTKKLLALVLVLTMALVMVPFSAGAADIDEYPDRDEVTYYEEFGLVMALDIIRGAGGMIAPQSTLNRSQAAILITRMLLGIEGARILEAARVNTGFSDVPSSHPDSGVIAFCAERGIIIGSGGRFAPRADVSIPHFAIMLLRALGHAGPDDYRGATGDYNAIIDAQRLGIFDGVIMDYTENLTRELAGLFTFNSLFVDSEEVVVKEAKYTIVTDPAANSGILAFNGMEFTTRLDAIQVGLAAGGDFVVSGPAASSDDFTVKEDGEVKETKGGLADTVYNLKKVTGKDDFGRPTTEYVVIGKADPIYTAVSSLAAGPYTGTVTGSRIFNDLRAAGLTANTINGATKEYQTDGVGGTAITIAANATSVTTAAHVGDSGAGVLTQVFYDAAKDTILVTHVNTYLARVTGVTNAAGATARSINFGVYEGGSASAVSVTGYETEEFVLNDMLLVTKTGNNLADIQSVVLAPKTENIAVARYSSTTNVTLAGASSPLSYSKKFVTTDGMINTGYDFTATYNFYLDNQGNVIGNSIYTGGTSALEFLLVMDAAITVRDGLMTPASIKAFVYYLDGTNDVVDISVPTATAALGGGQSTDGGGTLAAGNPYLNVHGTWYGLHGGDDDSPNLKTALQGGGAGTLFSYTVNSAGLTVLSNTLSTTTTPATQATRGNLTLQQNTPAIGVSGHLANASTKLVRVNTATHAHTNTTGISTFPSGTSNNYTDAVYVRTGNTVTDILVLDGNDIVAGTSPTAWAIYTGNLETAGTGITEYQLFVDGEVKYWRMSPAGLGGTQAPIEGVVYSFAEESDGRATLKEVTSNGGGSETGPVDYRTFAGRIASIETTHLVFAETADANYATATSLFATGGYEVYDVSGASATTWGEGTLSVGQTVAVITGGNPARIVRIYIVPTTANINFYAKADGTGSLSTADTAAVSGGGANRNVTINVNAGVGTVDVLLNNAVTQNLLGGTDVAISGSDGDANRVLTLTTGFANGASGQFLVTVSQDNRGPVTYTITVNKAAS